MNAFWRALTGDMGVQPRGWGTKSADEIRREVIAQLQVDGSEESLSHCIDGLASLRNRLRADREQHSRQDRRGGDQHHHHQNNQQKKQHKKGFS